MRRGVVVVVWKPRVTGKPRPVCRGARSPLPLPLRAAPVRMTPLLKEQRVHGSEFFSRPLARDGEPGVRSGPGAGPGARGPGPAGAGGRAAGRGGRRAGGPGAGGRGAGAAVGRGGAGRPVRQVASVKRRARPGRAHPGPHRVRRGGRGPVHRVRGPHRGRVPRPPGRRQPRRHRAPVSAPPPPCSRPG